MPDIIMYITHYMIMMCDHVLESIDCESLLLNTHICKIVDRIIYYMFEI